MKRMMLLMVVLGLANASWAQEHAPATQAGEHAASHSSASNHPQLPERAVWAGSMVIIIVAMFILAAAVGVVVRLNMPSPPPEPAHDDHGHGDDAHGGGAHGGHGH